MNENIDELGIDIDKVCIAAICPYADDCTILKYGICYNDPDYLIEGY